MCIDHTEKALKERTEVPKERSLLDNLLDSLLDLNGILIHH